jgi:hypothetical protein
MKALRIIAAVMLLPLTFFGDSANANGAGSEEFCLAATLQAIATLTVCRMSH